MTPHVGKYSKIILIAIALSFVSLGLRAQNIHFSNIFASHLTLNPASSTNFDGDMRTVMLYRAQGYNLGDAYKTMYLSFEKPFYILNEQINVGLYYSHDYSAENTLISDLLFLNIAKQLRLSLNNYFTGGIQLGYVNKRFSKQGLTLPDQYNRDLGGFDTHLATAEQFDYSSTNHLSVGAGVLFTHNLTNGSTVSGGYSIQNINQASETFFGITNKTPIRNILHAKADFSFGQNVFIIPACAGVWQGAAVQTLLGSNIGYSLGSNKKINNSIISGVFIRNGLINHIDGLIVDAGFSIQRWKFLTSYEFDISGLKSSYSSNTAFEFSLSYTLPSSKLTHIVHPSERY